MNSFPFVKLFALVSALILPAIGALAQQGGFDAAKLLVNGNSKQLKGDVTGAIEDYTRAIALDPKSALAFSSRGDAQQKRGDFAGAMADYKHALELDPKCAGALTGLDNLKANNPQHTLSLSDHNPAAGLARDSPLDSSHPGNFSISRGSTLTMMNTFAHATELSPASVNVLHRRALVKLTQNDLVGAMADLNDAVALAPRDASLYVDRGMARRKAEDFTGAMADYNRAIELDPKFAAAFSSRGAAKFDLNDIEGAATDLDRAIELDPKLTDAYLQRANTEYVVRDWMNAWADYRSFCDVCERPQDYAHIFIYLVRARIGERGAASKELSAYFDQRSRKATGEWISHLAGYLVGKVPEESLLAAAASPDAKTDRGQHCEAWYYVGMQQLLTGNKAKAAEDFRNCLATGQKTFVEYKFSIAELKALTP